MKKSILIAIMAVFAFNAATAQIFDYDVDDFREKWQIVSRIHNYVTISYYPINIWALLEIFLFTNKISMFTRPKRNREA